jgi:uncharacterized YigZ family protein
VQTIKTIVECTTEVKRSKFLTYLVPIPQYDGLQDKLKIQHPKANHVVYALRYLNEYDQIVENFSDDHEPKGCAGMPTLTVLRGEELINCAVLTVRYFGGIKLGTGGMARAYALAVKNVIAEATLVLYEKDESYSFNTSYSNVEKILYRLRKLNITEYEREFGIDSVDWTIVGSEEKIGKFKDKEL